MSAYKPLSAERTDVLRAKRVYGLWYGAALGLFFSTFAWGVDAYLLSQMNSLYPWLKFVGALVPCLLVGGFAGWLSARLDKPFIALLIWVVAAFTFAWLTVRLPFQIAPRLLGLFNPGLQDLLHYEYYPEFYYRMSVAFAWIAIFVTIAGVLQLPLSDSAVFSISNMGKLFPMLIGLVLMGVSGTIIDRLNNQLLRSPIQSLDATLQFYLDHKGEEVDLLESRKMHLVSLREVGDVITPTRSLIVSSYDAYLQQVKVLAKFDHAWVECDVFYEQTLNCRQISAPAP